MKSWREKTVVITGGSAGLGLAMAHAFARHGANVVLAARDAKALSHAARDVRRQSGAAMAVTADVTRQDDVDQLFAQTIDRYGRLDVLINNAGRSDRGRVLDRSVQEFHDLLLLNFFSVVRCTRAAAAHLIHSGGSLVNIGSLASKTASPYLGAYPASKFPVAAYTQQLRMELAEQGVHVLLVCPGPLRREDAGRRYDEQVHDLPDSARRPGGGVKLRGLDPARLAEQIVRACERRKAEIVAPAKARWLLALAQLAPAWADSIILQMTKG